MQDNRSPMKREWRPFTEGARVRYVPDGTLGTVLERNLEYIRIQWDDDEADEHPRGRAASLNDIGEHLSTICVTCGHSLIDHSVIPEAHVCSVCGWVPGLS
jgi:hypothetical protein